ncbi:retrovirus-related pol polyprotein from transposon TNT 1-94 [Tanacetum coccineum]
MLRRNLGDTLCHKGCDDSFLCWSMLRCNPSGMLRRKVPWALHFGAFLVQIPCLLLKCSLGTKLSYQERKCKLYNEFDKFTSIKGESLHEYYLRFAQLINDMHTIGMTMQQVQVGKVIVKQVQGRQGQSFASLGTKGNAISSRGNNAASQARVVKCYNCQREVHMARQCTKPKRPRISAWFKEKMLLVQVHESGQVLDVEQLAFLADPGIPYGQVVQITIPQNVAFQTDDLDAYDSDCDDISSAKAVLTANLSSYVTSCPKGHQITQQKLAIW